MEDIQKTQEKSQQNKKQLSQYPIRFFDLTNFILASQSTGPLSFQVFRKVTPTLTYDYIKLTKPVEVPFSYQTLDTQEPPPDQETPQPSQFSKDFDYLSTTEIFLQFNDASLYPQGLEERGWIVFDSANLALGGANQQNNLKDALILSGDLLFNRTLLQPNKLPPLISLGQYAAPIKSFFQTFTCRFKRVSGSQIFYDLEAQWDIKKLPKQQEVQPEKQE